MVHGSFYISFWGHRLEYSVDPAFCSISSGGLHYFPKYQFKGFQHTVHVGILLYAESGSIFCGIHNTVTTTEICPSAEFIYCLQDYLWRCTKYRIVLFSEFCQFLTDQ